MNCSKCGSTIDEKDKFCRSCGTPTSRISVNGMPNVSVSTSVLFKGMIIGVSAAVIVICSWLAYSAFRAYTEQYNQLIALGASPNDVDYLLTGTSGTIATCVPAVVYASFVLVESALDYFSPTASALLNSKKLINRIGNGFVIGGMLFVTLGLMNLIFEYFSLYQYPEAITADFIMIVTGLILLVSGIVVFAGSYFRSRKSSTKV